MNTFDTKWGLESGQIGGRKTAMILISWENMKDPSLLKRVNLRGEDALFRNRKEIFSPNPFSSK